MRLQHTSIIATKVTNKYNMDKLKETAAWVNNIVNNAIKTERINKKSNNKKK